MLKNLDLSDFCDKITILYTKFFALFNPSLVIGFWLRLVFAKSQ